MLPFFVSHGKQIVPNSMKHPRLLTSTPFSLGFFKVYFDFTYFICISPFLIRYNQITDSFEIFTSKHHQAICSVIHFFVLFQYLGLFRNMRLETLRLNPDNYFEFANVIGSLAYFLTLFSMLWRNQDSLLSIFKLVRNNFSLEAEVPKSQFYEIKKLIIPTTLCLIYFGLAMFSVFIGNVATNKWKFLEIPKSYYARANFVYLLQDKDEQVSSENSTLLLRIFTSWFVFIELYVWTACHFTDLLFFMSCIFLRMVANEFCDALNRKETTSCQGLHYYFTLRKIVQNLNAAVGPIAFCVIITGLPYHSSNVELVFSQVDVTRRLRVLFAWVIFVSSLVTAASANLKLDEMKEWLLRDGNANSISQSTLAIVTNELSHTGIKGWGFFTINYGFLGTILSVVLTYAILIVQLHSTGNPGLISNTNIQPPK